MAYLKLTNVNPNYLEGSDIVINLDNIDYMVAGGFGISVYTTTTEYNSAAGENDNFGFIGAPSGSTSDQIIKMLKEINSKGIYMRKILSEELGDHPFFFDLRGRGLRFSLEYSCKNNTAGPKSISKQELIKEFNMVI